MKQVEAQTAEIKEQNAGNIFLRRQIVRATKGKQRTATSNTSLERTREELAADSR